MKVVRFYEEGGPEVLKLEEMPEPEPAEGQVKVRIDVAGVSLADVQRRTGHYRVRATFPAVLGGSMVGTVVAAGPGVDGSLVGKQFLGSSSTGGYAQYGLASAAALEPIPEGVDAVAALSILAEAEVAAMVLKVAGRLKAGESVFVPAATGGIGYLAVQLAQLWGAGRVLGAASSEDKRAKVAELGAIPIDYTVEGWPKEVIAQNGGVGVELALEVLGGQAVYDTLETLRAGGRMVNYGNMNDTNAPVNPRQLLSRNLTLTGYFRGNSVQENLWPEERKAVMDEVKDFIISGKLKPMVGGTYSLEDAAKAHEALEGRATMGKVLLLPNS
jgi:NADPH2:quinone reductase